MQDLFVVTDIRDGRELLDVVKPDVRVEVGSAEVARVSWRESLVGEADYFDGDFLDSAGGSGCLKPIEDRVT